MAFHRVVIKIGDKEYDTRSMISTDNPVGEDWVMIADMVMEYIYGIRKGEDTDYDPSHDAIEGDHNVIRDDF